MTFHKSAKTHHYHIYPPSTISLEQLDGANPSHISWKVLIDNYYNQQEVTRMEKMNDVRQKLVVKHWFLKQNMPVDFFFPTKTLRWVNECENEMFFFRFLSNDWKLGFMPLFCLLSRILLKKMLSYCWESQPKLFEKFEFMF